ncbi:SNF2 family N-terminal domain-containing protein [Phlyctochytrium arcticum]|nr:SNF2 family N-terminal domain-containing protein [Phlyctochytrium arcticum]
MDIQTVQFFNNASSQQLIEAVICTPEQADFVIGLRPFLDIEHLRESLSGHKSQRQLARVVDKFQEVMEGYGEVDMLISRCERFGEEVMQVLRRWTKEDAQDTETGDDDEDLSGADGNYKCLSKQPAANNPDLTLKSYQLVGVSWLHMLHSKGLGGILADEMGLGKTAQVITFLGYLKAHGRRGPHLVVVPSSTLENWVREFNKWVPSLVVRSYYGSQRERDEMRDPLMDEIDEIDAIVTTYTLATGQKEDRVFLRKLHCHSLILDEGHMVKNMESARYKHLMSYKAPFRLLLTGTPLQNNLLELLALLTFIMPQLFANIESYSKIFNVKQSAAHGEAGFLSKQRIERAKKIMAPFVLRRKKAQVLKELPSKHVGIEDCTATPKQKELYDSILAESRKSLLQKDVAGEEAEAAKPQRKAKKGARPTPTKPKGAPFSEKKQIANCMMQLRKAADHPLLFRRFFSDAKLWTMSREIMREVEYMDANRDYIYEDMCIMSDFELHQLCCKFSSVKKHKLNSKHWMDAGKVKKLEELLQAMQANGDRALIFSQFVMMLDVLEAVLDTLGVRYLRLDGRTSVTERQALIDEYNTNMEVTVFLLSTKAGGFGINLTSANVVIIYDLDFNPHNDAQAEDRAHRVGQTRDVRVIKLIMKDTVEEHILRLATAKLKLDAKVQQRDEITELEDTKKPIARGRKGKSKEGEDAGAEGRESRESEGELMKI